MARNGRPSVMKRERERRKAEKAERKRERREQRKSGLTEAEGSPFLREEDATGEGTAVANESSSAFLNPDATPPMSD